DGVAEVREAVDFLRYYAAEAETTGATGVARGPIVCISPWNFPLAIFTGQIAAALAAGNPVLAKPAEQTPLIAARAVELLHSAGIAHGALQLLPGAGATVGGALVRDPRIGGVCFTGSTATARSINRAMAQGARPDAMLIAETGGLNAMIVDSTALIEQAVRDIVASSFQSAGQRCSALRMLYVQEDVAGSLLHMLGGAMAELAIGDPWSVDTDVGPVIDAESQARIETHVEVHAASGQLVEQLSKPGEGLYVAPALIEVAGIEMLEEEVFGPVLHFASFEADELHRVIDAVNAKGYGLTFGLHTRMSTRIEDVCTRIRAGNVYVNRNQIGAVVGTQPFGGEGLSGTGPKAGGPHYVQRFRQICTRADRQSGNEFQGTTIGRDKLQSVALALAGNERERWAATEPGDRVERLASTLGPPVRSKLAHLDVNDMACADLPGPTGESNILSLAPRGTVLCLGPRAEDAQEQTLAALAAGNAVLVVAEGGAEMAGRLGAADLPVSGLDGQIDVGALRDVARIDAVACRGDRDTNQRIKRALAARAGPLIALLDGDDTNLERLSVERHVCIDTTAAGGNASLLSGSES
ncbi:MAG: L-glutamate gamma-semialdehyde dehydrogenase, partial [Gammaproteobacteria bacterium]